MDLHGEFFFGEEKLHQQREAMGIGSGTADKLRAELSAQLGKRALRKRAIRDRAVVAGEPCFTDFFSKFAIRVDVPKIERSLGARIEERRHQHWVGLAHAPKMFLFRYSLRNLPWGSYFLARSMNSGIFL